MPLYIISRVNRVYTSFLKEARMLAEGYYSQTGAPEDDDYNYLPEDNSIDDYVSLSSSASTNRKKQRRLLDASLLQDKRFHRFLEPVNGGKPVAVDVYSTSSVPGSPIRGAVTGSKYYQYRTGSVDEYQFFKVTDCRGKTMVGRPPNSEPISLFFDSPEQYEKHFSTKVPAEEKQRWADRAVRYRMLAAQNTPSSEFVIIR
jgi:hypothetical protein